MKEVAAGEAKNRFGYLFDAESYRLREAKEQAAKRSMACSPRSAKSRASSMGDIPPPKAWPI